MNLKSCMDIPRTSELTLKSELQNLDKKSIGEDEKKVQKMYALQSS